MENNIIPTVGVLVMKNGMVLLVRHGEASEHSNGKYGLPAGRMQNNESAGETACRELKEETGLDADLDSLVRLPGEWFAAIKRKDGTKKFSLAVFLADKFDGQLSGSIETAPEWINIKDLKRYDLLPNVFDIISEGLKLLRI
jgi:ADP-ribose pyrophosphatase YjhB (NUDIX family)